MSDEAPWITYRQALKVLGCTIRDGRFVELREKVEWGPLVPYNITGLMNCHPRAAIEFRDGPRPNDFVVFYDKVAGDV